MIPGKAELERPLGSMNTYYGYGLRRSCLIMGVHPGCPVCSIVAASLVAVETDVGETISEHLLTSVKRRKLKRYGKITRSSGLAKLSTGNNAKRETNVR